MNNSMNDKDKNELNDYSCYIIISKGSNRTYIGSTNNVERRLRQHNGEIKGGAKATKIDRPWRHICVISGLNKIEALCCEWRLKRKHNYKGQLKGFYGVNKKIENMYNVLNLDRYTKKCSLSRNTSLLLIWLEKKFRLDIDLPENVIEIIL